jgi:hypothetical protein
MDKFIIQRNDGWDMNSGFMEISGDKGDLLYFQIARPYGK